MLVRIMKKRNPPWFWRFPCSSMSLEHAKTIGKHSVFVACMHHAREPALLFSEKGLVVESGAAFDMNLGIDFRGNVLQMLVRIMKKMQPSMVLACCHVHVCIGIGQTHWKIRCFRGLHAPRSRTSTTFIGKGTGCREWWLSLIHI